MDEQSQLPGSHEPVEGSVQRRTLLFNKHVLPHINLIYKLCIKYSYCQADIEDNYNEALINFFKYIETYDPKRSIQTWLHIVTKRFVGDMNTKNSSFKRSEDLCLSEIPADSVSEIGEKSGNCFRVEDYVEHYNDDILSALESMKPIYREALLLQQAGFKLNEIMEIAYKNGSLKVKNIETIKSRLFLAKEQMRKKITRDGQAKGDTE